MTTPACPNCAEPLDEHAPTHACERCLSRTRRLISETATLYALLPADLLLHSRSGLALYGGGTEEPLPGGDVLALLSPGSEGWDEDGITSQDGDLPSISYELGWWAHDIAEHRHEFVNLGGRPGTVVRHSTAYLERHARWAAQSYEGFPDFSSDIRRLHSILEHATGRALRHTRANADCFSCGGQLIRRDDPDQGVADEVTCDQCGRRYDHTSYLLALRQKASEAAFVTHDGAQYGSLQAVARTIDRPLRTVQAWARRGKVRTWRRVGQPLICLDDARSLIEVPA